MYVYLSKQIQTQAQTHIFSKTLHAHTRTYTKHAHGRMPILSKRRGRHRNAHPVHDLRPPQRADILQCLADILGQNILSDLHSFRHDIFMSLADIYNFSEDEDEDGNATVMLIFLIWKWWNGNSSYEDEQPLLIMVRIDYDNNNIMKW